MKILVAILIVAVVTAVGSCWSDYQWWESYKVEHHCKMVEINRNKAAYLCDDGIKYWR